MATGGGFTAGRVFVELHAKTQQFAQQMKSAESELYKFTRGVQSSQQEMTGFQRQVATTAIGVGALSASFAVAAKRAFGAAADVSEMNQAIGAIERSSGLTAGAISGAAKSVRGMGIEMKSAQEIAILFAQGNLDLAQASKVARVAQDLAVISQSNSTQTAMTLAYAIQTGNSQLLKSAGITKYASEAYAEYASTIGKVGNDLTNTERQQALVNMVIAEGEKVAGTYSAAMMEPGKVLRSFPRLLNDMSIEFGNVLLGGFGPMIKASYDLTKRISQLFIEGGYLNPMLQQLGVAVTNLLTPFTSLITNLASGVDYLNTFTNNFDGLAASAEALIPGIAAIAAGMSTLAGQSVLRLLPGFEKLAVLLGPVSPVAVGLGILVALTPKLRKSLAEIISGAQPLIAVFGEVGQIATELFVDLQDILVSVADVLAGPIGGALGAFGVALAGTLVAVAPLVNFLAEVVKLAVQFEPIVYAAAVALLAYKANMLLATFATTTFGNVAVAAASKATLAFLSMQAAMPILLAISAAVVAIGAAFKAYSDRNKDAQERTKELTGTIRELTDAFLEGKSAAEGLASGMDVVEAALLEDSEETDKFKDSLLDLGIVFDDLAGAMLSADADFDGFMASMLETNGITGDLADEISRVVNAYDKGVSGSRMAEIVGNAMRLLHDDTFVLTDDIKQVIIALEEVQDQTENLELSDVAMERLKDLRREGLLSIGVFESLRKELEEGANAENIMARAIDIAALSSKELSSEMTDVTDKLRLAQQNGGETTLALFSFAEALGLVEVEAGQTAYTLDQFIQQVLGLELVTYKQDSAMRQAVRSANGFANAVANLDKDQTNLAEAGDLLVSNLYQQLAAMETAGVSRERQAALTEVMANQFIHAADTAGYERQAVLELVQALGILDSTDVEVDFSFGVEKYQKQLRSAQARLAKLANLVGFTSGQYEATKAVVDQLQAMVDVFGSFEEAGAASFEYGSRKVSSEVGTMTAEVEELTDSLTILDKKFQDIVQTLLDPVFTQAEADVFLESLNKRAQELVGNLSQITAAQGLLEMQDQLSGVLGILREMVAGGASVDQLNEFVAGAMSGLQTLGATLGVSVDDFAQIAAALTAAGQEATNVAEFNRYVAEQGLTPAEAAALDAFFASQAPAATSIGAGSLTATGGGQVVTNVTVNLPPGVSGQDVIDALYDYATTQGATVPAPFQFVNVG